MPEVCKRALNMVKGHTNYSGKEMAQIYQHQTLRRPIDNGHNKGIGEITTQ